MRTSTAAQASQSANGVTPAIKLSETLSLPLSAVTEAFAITGIRESGKTTVGVDLLEEIVGAHQPAVVADPLDVWYGVRSSRNGKKPGLPVYIFGGRHADIPLEARAGEIIARFVVEARVPIVLSLRHLNQDFQRGFMADFATALYHLNTQPLQFIIDEAKRFCPQTITREQRRCAQAIIDISTEGRTTGLGITLIGQRPALINKDALSQTGTLIIMRTQSPQDRAAIELWIGEHADPMEARTMMRELATLPQGVGYVWSPSTFKVFQKVHFRNRHTFDSSRTPTVDMRSVAPSSFATVDLAALRGNIAATLERAKLEDPRELRARIAELEAKLRSVPTTTVQVSVLTDGDRALLERTAAAVSAAQASVDAAAPQIRTAAGEVSGLLERAIAAIAATPSTDAAAAVKPLPAIAAITRPLPAVKAAPAAIPPSTGTAASTGLSKGAEGLASVLAARFPMVMTKGQLATFSGRSIRSSSYMPHLKELIDAGFAEVSYGKYSATSRAIAAFPNESLSTESVLDGWYRSLPARAAEMLRVLVACQPEALERDELARRSGASPTSSAVGSHLGMLHLNGLIQTEKTEGRKIMIRLSDTLANAQPHSRGRFRQRS